MIEKELGAWQYLSEADDLTGTPRKVVQTVSPAGHVVRVIREEWRGGPIHLEIAQPAASADGFLGPLYLRVEPNREVLTLEEGVQGRVVGSFPLLVEGSPPKALLVKLLEGGNALVFRYVRQSGETVTDRVSLDGFHEARKHLRV